MAEIESIRRILNYWKRPDLAALLATARLDLRESDQYGSFLFSRLTTAEIYAPFPNCEKLRALPDDDYHIILRALLEVFPPKPYAVEISNIEFFLDTLALEPDGMNDDQLVAEIEAQRATMIAVSTGGPRIQIVDQEYRQRRTKIQEELQKRGIPDANPYGDLWAWYGKWSSGDLPSYYSRRQYISQLLDPLIERIRQKHSRAIDEPTGWIKVDRGLGEVRKRLAEAQTEEQFQAVGLLCRETLISLAQTVYDTFKHGSPDGVAPSATDGKRMLEAYIATELGGGSHEVARKHVRASLELANDLQHKRTAAFKQAALCAEATASVVNIVAILSGQREPSS